MNNMLRAGLLALGLISAAAQTADDTAPVVCNACEGWNEAVEPRAMAAHTWFVGTKGLGAVLIADPAGLVLIDGGLPQSAMRILANVRKLGFKPEDIRWVLNSHAHFDHAGGIAALARITGAKVGAGAQGVVALQSGLFHPDDAQLGFGEAARYPAVESVVAFEDGDVVRVGALEITAIATPGHAPGGMSWTWRACSAERDCRQVVYLDSLNAVSTHGYRFSEHPKVLAQLRESLARVARLDCDVVMAAHPDQVPGAASTGDKRSACTRYADAAAMRLERRLEQERNEIGRRP